MSGASALLALPSSNYCVRIQNVYANIVHHRWKSSQIKLTLFMSIKCMIAQTVAIIDILASTKIPYLSHVGVLRKVGEIWQGQFR